MYMHSIVCVYTFFVCLQMKIVQNAISKFDVLIDRSENETMAPDILLGKHWNDETLFSWENFYFLFEKSCF